MVSPPEKFLDYVLKPKSYNLVHFGRKMVRNAVDNAFVNASTIGTVFHTFH